MTDVDALMKRCQAGVGGRNALDEAHNIMAECYGVLGRQQAEIEQLRANLVLQQASYEREIALDVAAERERWRSAAEYAAHKLEGARIWNGQEWAYNPLHPMHYRSALERLRNVLKA